METAALKMLAIGIAIGLGVFGPGIGLGLATKAMIESIARQPEAESKMKIYFWAGAGLIEACAIYALFVVLMLAFVIK